MSTYSTRHIAGTFNVSKPTVRSWAIEFAEHLSDRAKPDKGTRRVFTEEDMKVFALVAQRKREGYSKKQILDDLAAGQRGDKPDQLLAYVPVSDQLAVFQARVMELEARAKRAEDSLAASEGKNELLQSQLREANEKIQELNRTIGQLQAQQSAGDD